MSLTLFLFCSICSIKTAPTQFGNKRKIKENIRTQHRRNKANCMLFFPFFKITQSKCKQIENEYVTILIDFQINSISYLLVAIVVNVLSLRWWRCLMVSDELTLQYLPSTWRISIRSFLIFYLFSDATHVNASQWLLNIISFPTSGFRIWFFPVSIALHWRVI